MAATLVRPATHADALALAAVLRPAELVELDAASGRPPAELIVEAVRDSDEAWALELGGELAGIFGVMRLGRGRSSFGRWGSVWLLTSSAVERFPIAFWKVCRRWVPVLCGRWDLLVNYIDVRHEKALRWAARLGFRIEAPAPYGVRGLPFQRFVATREVLCV